MQEIVTLSLQLTTQELVSDMSCIESHEAGRLLFTFAFQVLPGKREPPGSSWKS